MKLATLACLSALCLLPALAHAAPGDPATAEPPRTEQGTPAPKAAPARNEAPAPRGEARTEAGRGEKPAAAPAVSGRERRRPSYASCNRASHQRGYRGGRRRRFLIRCRLGYERPRAAQHQAPAAPAAPVRKP